MRTAIFIVVVSLAASTAAAQQQFNDSQPDYSRETLLRLFAENPEREDANARFRHRFGAIEFQTRGVRWRVGYLPFFLPLHGSMPWVNGHRWPDPFILTNTEIAHTPRTWRDQRAMSAELRRIERRLRDSATIRVQPE